MAVREYSWGQISGGTAPWPEWGLGLLIQLYSPFAYVEIAVQLGPLWANVMVLRPDEEVHAEPTD